jgi:hypothetical protein
MMIRALALLCVSLLWVACDSDSTGESGSTNPSSTLDGGEGSFVSAPDEGCSSLQIGEADVPHMGPGAGITGLVLDNDCNPLPNFKVLCCTDDSCVPTDTRADGTFYMGAIMNQVPRKVRIVGVTHGFYDALVYLPVTGEELTIASKPIVLAPLADYVALSAEAGGTATLATGQIEITVAAGSMKYPLGHFTDELSAQRVDQTLVGPFDTAPYMDAEGAMAFVFDPYDMKVEPTESGDEAVSFAFHAEDHAPAGTVYDIWSADTHNAHLEAVGTATVGDDGVIHTDEGHTITSLQTIVIVPQ